MPAGDTELEIVFRGGDNFHVTCSPEGNVYIYIEENDDETMALEHAHFRVFETGENVAGYYLGTVLEGKNAQHVYWTNYMESANDPTRDIRVADVLPEVRDAGGSSLGDDTPGQSEDV